MDGAEEVLVPIFGILVPIVGCIALFSYLAVANRADNNRRESEARARYEFLKKMAEGGGFDAQKLIEYEQTEQRFRRLRRAENLSLGGMILLGIGIAVGGFLYVIDPVWSGGMATIGLFPGAVGGALLAGALMLKRPV